MTTEPTRPNFRLAGLADARSSAAASATEASDVSEELWIAPPFQPLRAIAALLLTACGFGLYEYVLVSFWSVPGLGIHDRIPWPAFGLLAAALAIALSAVGVAVAIRSPHAKLGLVMLAFLACLVVGVGGGRFVSYTLRGTLNPPFTLNLKAGDRFPPYALADQTGAIRRGPGEPDAAATLIYIYRGDFCPFARFELADLTAHADDFHHLRASVVAISADPVERAKILARYLATPIPLLCDPSETVLRPLGLVQHHRNGEPDNTIPAVVIVDRSGVVRWTRTSRFYRELPRSSDLLEAVRSVTTSGSR